MKTTGWCSKPVMLLHTKTCHCLFIVSFDTMALIVNCAIVKRNYMHWNAQHIIKIQEISSSRQNGTILMDKQIWNYANLLMIWLWYCYRILGHAPIHANCSATMPFMWLGSFPKIFSISEKKDIRNLLQFYSLLSVCFLEAFCEILINLQSFLCQFYSLTKSSKTRIKYGMFLNSFPHRHFVFKFSDILTYKLSNESRKTVLFHS